MNIALWEDVPQWRINSVGLTMLRIPAGKVEDGQARSIGVPQGLFIGDREITVGQFQQFIDDPDYSATEKPKDWQGSDTKISPTAEHPAQQVSWYDAVLFCNWLSLREGREPCYERTGEKDKEADGKPTQYEGWRPVPRATGYRLPTADEWEYACRAKTTTNFSSGDGEERLKKYAVFGASRTNACGSKLCNPWGLYDMHGNVLEWCSVVDAGSLRVNRGGGWSHSAKFCRSWNRYGSKPSFRGNDLGFRVARGPQAEEVASGAESVGR